MSLRDDIQADIAEAFDTDLADAVRSFTGSREVVGEYDPISGEQPIVNVTYEGRGVFGGYSVEQADGQHILATDTKLTALQNELTDTPQEGDHIDGMRVVRVQKDPAAATWNLTLRRT